MFSLVAQQLSAGMQHIEAILAHTMNVIALLRETAFVECARFVFQEFFETVTCQLFIFDVIRFMFFCGKWTKKHFICIFSIGMRVNSGEGRKHKRYKLQTETQTHARLALTHFSFIFECVIAAIPNAVEMRCALAGKTTIVGITLFGRTKTLKTAENLMIFFVCSILVEKIVDNR